MELNKPIIEDLTINNRTYSTGGGSYEDTRRAKLPTITRLSPQHKSYNSINMKKNKFLIYTSNLDVMPKTMADVIEFAERSGKYLIANVELNPCLGTVKEGDNVFTKKGNSLYVIKAFTESLDEMSSQDSEYIETLTRSGKLRKMNITSVSKIVDFTTWCKNAKPLIKEKMKSNSVKGMSERIKDMFMPSKAEGVRVSVTDGSICVETSEGFISITSGNELVSYPEELTLDIPVFVVSKPKDQLVVGDVIKLSKSYAKVTKIEGDKISAISYTGAGKTVHTTKDFLFNQTMVRVVMSLAGGVTGGQVNPMLLMALSEGDKSDMLPFLMMSQPGGVGGMNPMLLMAMSKGEDSDGFSVKDALMMSALTGQNLFGGQQAPAGN